jgi:hypothetical protein
MTQQPQNLQQLLVFQQNQSARRKIEGIQKYGKNQFSIQLFSIDQPLPPILDNSDDYLPDAIEADVVLDFLTHPDLSHDLAQRCRQLKIPVVASGKKIKLEGIFAPPT